jgi:class 3 adenylate cyclase
MANLPTGTITFLFSDIEGSSRLWERYPRAMPSALVRHDTILREMIVAQGGVVFKTVGDGYHAAFQRAMDAVCAALDAQRVFAAEPWDAVGLPASEPLRVRMAIHTGVAELRDGDYFGPTLNRVARLMDAAHGGQILLSRVSADLVHDLLSSDVTLRDLGSHELRNLSHPEQIFQLVPPDLATPLLPLRTPQTQSTAQTKPSPLLATKLYLPAPRATAVSRPRLVARLLKGLSSRLTLIAAPAGFGKSTLLAQALAARTEDRGLRTERGDGRLSPQSSILSPGGECLRKQRALAKPGRGSDEREPRAETLQQARNQPRSAYSGGARSGQI